MARWRSLFLALVLALSAWPALASRNYQDMWWLPDESGWGLMVLHQGDVISAVMFHYRADGKPAWYLLSNAPRGTEEFFTGTLYEVTGPPLFGLFNPAAVLPRNVGSMTLHFTGINEATLSYTIDGATTMRPIQRISYANLGVDGIYFGSQVAVFSCDNSPEIGSYVFPAEFDIVASAIRDTRVTTTILGGEGVFCDWTDGNFTQAGSMIHGEGLIACRDGNSAPVSFGSFEVEQMRVADHAVSINYRTTLEYPTAGVSCTERGLLSGTRLVRPD
ncbi:MAG: hypothetical protein AB7E72_13225 [Lysobacterales bacterium]